MVDSTGPVILSVGIDWLTVTAKAGPRADALSTFGRVMVVDEAARGNRIRVWGGHGYEGRRAGQAGWGTRADDSLLELQGSTADLYALAALQLADRCSRIDLQTTILDRDRDPQTVALLGRYAPEGGNRRGRTITRHLIDDSRRGRTLYVGSPRSMMLGRIYDKHRESPDQWPPGALRFEVQCRRAVADRWRTLAGQNGLHRSVVFLSVAGWFDARGVPVGVGERGVWPADAPPRQPSDVGQSLDYLRRFVAPRVRWLCEQGYRADALRALGLG